MSKSSGFTLIELLVVIAIVAILAIIAMLTINPVQIRGQARDATRLSNFDSIRKSIENSLQESDLTGTEILCNPPAGAPCVGRSSDVNTQLINGTGWVKVNISTNQAYTLPYLPVDPVNDNDMLYTYCSDGLNWEINTKLESFKYASLQSTDGGDQDDIFETGSNLNLIKESGGLCTYTP